MVDFMKMEVVRGHVQIPLALKEFRTLEFMIKNARRAISRGELLNEVSGYENYPCTCTVDNHILKLRQKLENDPPNPVLLVTMNGLGYNSFLSSLCDYRVAHTTQIWKLQSRC
jgi:DNA-binding response OmpR family regulator